MKTRLGKLLWKSALVFIVVGIISAVLLSRPDYAAQKVVAETRQALRAQGFKTDLADFDFSTSPELRAREAILKATTPDYRSERFTDYPDLMTPAGTDSAIMLWKQDSPETEYGKALWPLLHQALDGNQAELDAACNAALSGPIGFNLNAKGGNAILLPHLAMLKNLTQALNSRAMLDLHDGRKDAAWTNLLASTRLVTAWESEPIEISHLVRFADMNLVFNATWQVLQAHGWPDDKLAHLQAEWETVDFFTNLTETMAFKRASAVAECQRQRNPPPNEQFSRTEFLKWELHHPLGAASDLNSLWKRHIYLKHGSYEDETNLFIFYRDREQEFRNAIPAPTWSQMRQLPGVTNNIFFYSKYRSRLQALMNLHEISTAFLKRGSSFLGRAAASEARRRILITAIALERYRGKHGSYPKTLSELAPEFIKTPMPDFMDGQPLRYRLTGDGYFVLYSVGLDCVDDGGTLPPHDWETSLPGGAPLYDAPPQADLVWPRPD